MERAKLAVDSIEEFRRKDKANRVKMVDVFLKEGTTVRRLCD